MKNPTCHHCGEAVDLRVAAVRADKLVGSRTPSYVNNTFTDGELIAFLDDAGATTPTKAIREMRSYERLIAGYASDIQNA